MLHKGVRAHGGQGATAGQVATAPRIDAVFRGTSRMIRVWDGHGDAEEFTVDEARQLCARGDQALLDGWTEFGRTQTGLWVGSEGAGELLVCGRQWLIAFLAAVRRALRTADTARMLARMPYDGRSGAALDGRGVVIDEHSDPGSWDRHLRHTSIMQAAIG